MFEAAGFTAVGVDLFSNDKRIRRMDMHHLQLEANEFDMVYACHSLEHAMDSAVVASEIIRVARSGAVCTIEVPINFRTSITDRQDYGSVEGVQQLFGAAVAEVFFQEEAEDQQDGRVARLAFAVRKG